MVQRMRQGGQQRQVSFAELEWQAQGIRLEPSLQCLSDFLDRHDELLGLVASDLRRGLKQPAAGREGLSAVQVLRSFILQRVKDWDFRELRERVADGLTLRQFAGFYAGRVPRHQAFHRAFKRLTLETVRALNQAVVLAAVELGIEHGHQLRVDTTVVQTNIRFPTDATLLWDCVRVLTRLAGRIVAQLPALPERLHNHTRFARRRMQQLQRMTPAQRRRAQGPAYRRLITVTTQVVANARTVAKAAAVAPRKDEFAACRLAQLIAQIESYSGRAARVINQARRRVLEGEQVAAAEKLYSIFEPHTDLIKRGKLNTPVEFGHKVFFGREPPRLDYRLSSARWQSAGRPFADTGPEASRPLVRPAAAALCRRPRLLQYRQYRLGRCRRGFGEHSATRRPQDPRAGRFREEPCLQARAKVSRRHRRTDQRAGARTRHEALSSAWPSTLRAVSWRRSAR